jgi:sugar phosphate isomerase/epimerase
VEGLLTGGKEKNMNTTRREFLGGALAAGATLAVRPSAVLRAEKSPPTLRVGSCMIGLEAARKAGLDGVQVPVKLEGEQLDVAGERTLEAYKQKMRETGLPICGLMLGLLNSYPLASDPRGPGWLEQAIDAARDLDARVILVAFFGKGDLLAPDGKVKQAEVDAVVERLKVAAPRAGAAGVVLALENYLDARQNLAILDRLGREAVQVYYDVYNTGVTRGYDVPAEIRLLRGRIAQFHFKNGPQFLGEGKFRFEPIVAAIKEIGYRGWIVLETSSPTKDPVADARRNARYVKNLLGAI